MEWLLTGNGPKYPGQASHEVITALQLRYHSATPATKALIELCLDLPVTGPLPDTVSPTLRNLLNGARLLAEQNLPRQ
ncbi:MAG TPA: hypothetical protein VFS13_00765 [Steroidobacteraceae bacterium]|nr:hypothetical protein [Steroidobacteraceae bacterium]